MLVQSTMILVLTTLGCIVNSSSAASSDHDVMDMITKPSNAAEEKRHFFDKLNSHQRLLQASKLQEDPFQSQVVKPSLEAINRPRSYEDMMDPLQQDEEADNEVSQHARRQLQAPFCLEQDGAVNCIVEPNFPQDGFFSFFRYCQDGGTLRQCQECFVLQTCCLEDLDESTPFCESCGVCSSGGDENVMSWTCPSALDSSCPGRSCNDACIGGTASSPPPPPRSPPPPPTLAPHEQQPSSSPPTTGAQPPPTSSSNPAVAPTDTTPTSPFSAAPATKYSKLFSGGLATVSSLVVAGAMMVM